MAVAMERFIINCIPDVHIISFPVYRIQINQIQMKTKASLTAMKVERKAFALPTCTCIWLVFPKC